MKRFALGMPMSALVAFLVVGCTTPYTEVHVKPFTSPSERRESVDPKNPAIQDALTIIDAVLRRHGFVKTRSFPDDRESDLGWSFSTTYSRDGEDATVHSTGRKQSVSAFEEGKGSVDIWVVFSNPNRWFVKMPLKITSVRDEIAEALGNRFGKDKVVVSENKKTISVNW